MVFFDLPLPATRCEDAAWHGTRRRFRQVKGGGSYPKM